MHGVQVSLLLMVLPWTFQVHDGMNVCTPAAGLCLTFSVAFNTSHRLLSTQYKAGFVSDFFAQL